MNHSTIFLLSISHMTFELSRSLSLSYPFQVSLHSMCTTSHFVASILLANRWQRETNLWTIGTHRKTKQKAIKAHHRRCIQKLHWDLNFWFHHSWILFVLNTRNANYIDIVNIHQLFYSILWIASNKRRNNIDSNDRYRNASMKTQQQKQIIEAKVNGSQ